MPILKLALINKDNSCWTSYSDPFSFSLAIPFAVILQRHKWDEMRRHSNAISWTHNLRHPRGASLLSVTVADAITQNKTEGLLTMSLCHHLIIKCMCNEMLPLLLSNWQSKLKDCTCTVTLKIVCHQPLLMCQCCMSYVHVLLSQESWVLSLIVSTPCGSDQLQLKSLI